MMKTLFARLSFALLTIVLLMGGAFYTVDRLNTRAYYEELSQSVNAPIAMYVTAQDQLITDGTPNLDALHALSGHAMVINPTAEIYLLGRDGRILGHGLSDAEPVLDSVDLAPVTALIAESASLPLRGDDPRTGAERKIFSAAEVHSPRGLEGYLYVVLGGRTYDALAADIGDSYVGRATLIAFLAILGIAAVVGLLTFGLLTRRLKRLRRELRKVISSGFEHQPELPAGSVNGDEIDELGSAVVDMSKRIATQVEQLKENDRLRRELVTNISHDLRTPLSAMQGYVETLILRKDSLDERERDRYLGVVRKHTLRLGQLIGDLFELSKLDSVSMTPSVESFSIAELIQDVAQEFRLEAEQKNIRLSLDVDTGNGMTEGDIGLIQRVLENLVRNAIKYTPAGGEVVLSLSEKPTHLAVAVADTGNGIAEEEIPKIFDRFYRARDGEEARSDSSGIGLAIVKRILDIHGSCISVTSRLEAGTRFEFDLPAVRTAA